MIFDPVIGQRVIYTLYPSRYFHNQVGTIVNISIISGQLLVKFDRPIAGTYNWSCEPNELELYDSNMLDRAKRFDFALKYL